MHIVQKLSASTLYLTSEQAYRGACILVYDLRHVVRIDQLDSREWLDLAGDLWRAESAIFRALSPDHINIECLGSIMPHLHWHIIPRYKDDARWGGPIWTTRREEMPGLRLDETGYRQLAGSIAAEMTSSR